MKKMVWRSLPTWRKITLILGILLLVPPMAFVAYVGVYEQMRFQYVINLVESAKTAAEEEEAFALAARVGKLWELNWLEPHELPPWANHIKGGRVLEMEWLESSIWTQRPFRAYRRVIDTNNMPWQTVRQ